MSDNNVLKALAKVIVALAWTDGTVTYEEVNQVKELLIGFPHMTVSDWAEVDIYVDSPVGDAERQRLVAELQGKLSNTQDQQLALNALDSLITADGKVTEEERLALAEIRSAIENTNLKPLSGMGRLFRKPAKPTPASIPNAPNRELFMDDYLKNRIFYNVNRRLTADKIEAEVSQELLWKLSLAGGLMARVAFIDKEVGDLEFDMMVKSMHEHWGISEFQANLVAEAAISDITKGLDDYQLSSQFFECTTDDERLHFLDALFSVAAESGGVTFQETEEIRAISTVLKLTHQQFIAAKLKIPEELRPGDSILSKEKH
jgi:uncharacterized tellurite resistance protein B-like protein